MSWLYTICFCRRRGKVLMLHRNKPPNDGLWNGLGGKIEPGESPLDCIRREVWEEAAIDLHGAARLRFAGIVSWTSGVDRTRPSTGMYAYVADLDDDCPACADQISTPDGLLAWQPIAWVCDRANGVVVANLPYVLPRLFADTHPAEQHCQYVDGQLVGVVTRPLSPVIVRHAAVRVESGWGRGVAQTLGAKSAHSGTSAGGATRRCSQ